MFTLSKKIKGDHYDIVHAVTQDDTTFNTVIGTAKRDSAKPRFFNFVPTDEGRAMGLATSLTFDRMKASPGGPGLLDELTTKLTPPARTEQPKPELRKVTKKDKAAVTPSEPEQLVEDGPIENEGSLDIDLGEVAA